MKLEGCTVDSRYYGTAGIREMYQYSQTIDITGLNLYCLVMVRVQILYRNKQYVVKTDILITRDYCIWTWNIEHCKFANQMALGNECYSSA